MHQSQGSPRTQEVLDACLPLIRALAVGRYAITIGGSHGKGFADHLSDIDFKLFCDDTVGGAAFRETEAWHAFTQEVARWRAEGVEIDSCWVRTIAAIDAQIDTWLAGQIAPPPIVWTLWGYQLLTDIASQVIIEDPDGVAAGWHARLTPYPPALGQAIIAKHLSSLRYWRDDYHYRSKVARGDLVFLAGIASRLVHDMLQVLFALNQAYYVGDGNNLPRAEAFTIKPRGFADRVAGILYPTPGPGMLEAQHAAICALIDEVAELAAHAAPDS